MKNKYRTIYCGEVTKENIGEEIKVAGWVEQIRNLGSLVFLTLRDETGLIQLISEEKQKRYRKSKAIEVTIKLRK